MDSSRWALLAAVHTSAAVVVHAPDTSILWANQTAADLLGISRDQLTGKLAIDPAFRFLAPDRSELEVADYPVMRALAERKDLADMEVGVRRNGERVMWGRVSAVPVFGSDELEAVVVSFVDDSELHAARRQLAEERERLARAVEGTSDVLWDIDPATEEMWVARRFARLVGASALPTVQGLDGWTQWVHPDDRRRARSAFEEHTRSGAPLSVQFRLRHADGSWLHVLARAQLVEGTDGRLRSAGALTDVTAQVRAEAERRDLDARMELAARLESLAVLSGGVAHDFNNLLTAIIGAVDSAREAPADPRKASEAFELVMMSAERASELTRQLMTYAGHGPAVVEVVQPGQVVTSLAKLVRGSLPSEARLEVEVSDTTPAVAVDRTQLHQVVMNLLVNAADAVEPRGRVAVHTRSVERTAAHLAQVHSNFAVPGLFAEIEVADDGHGMSAATQQRVFEPFFTTKAQGHGLGLASLLGLVRAYGGYVDLHSELQAGTRFAIGLPASDQPVRLQPPPGREGPVGDGLRALMVEDDAVVAKVVRRQLERWGFEVEWLSDGEQFPQRVAQFDPHVVVLDVTLPGRSGLELLAELRRANDDRAVVVSSGHIDVEARLGLHRDERTRVLAKPFAPPALLAELTTLLSPA